MSIPETREKVIPQGFQIMNKFVVVCVLVLGLWFQQIIFCLAMIECDRFLGYLFRHSTFL